MTVKKKSLANELRNDWGQSIKNTGKYKPKRREDEIGRLIQLYTNAIANPFDFYILGDAKLRSDQNLMMNVGTVSTTPQVKFPPTISYLEPIIKSKANEEKLQKTHKINYNAEYKKRSKLNTLEKEKKLKQLDDTMKHIIKKEVNIHLRSGAVLNESNWWILPNDMFMLALTHAKKEVHVASKDGQPFTDDMLWDKSNGRPRALGRELIQLYEAGYRLAEESNANGLEYVLIPPEDDTEEITITKLRGFVQNKNLEDIQKILKNRCDVQTLDPND